MFFHTVYKSGQIFLPFCHNSRVWQTDGRTDERTDRQTEFSSLDRVYIPCSAVKTRTWTRLFFNLRQGGGLSVGNDEGLERAPMMASRGHASDGALPPKAEHYHTWQSILLAISHMNILNMRKSQCPATLTDAFLSSSPCICHWPPTNSTHRHASLLPWPLPSYYDLEIN